MREDQLALYGFATPLELAVFERLIAVSGIGPKLALAVLSGIEPRELVGRDPAQRRGAADARFPASARRPPSASASSCAIGCRRRSIAGGAPRVAGDALRDDLVSALANLGYHRQAIDKALDKLLASAAATPRSKTCCGRR